MKLLRGIAIVVFSVLSMVGISQNGFTTYTTNLTITGTVKLQSAFLVDNSNNKWLGFRTFGSNSNAGLVKYDNTGWTLYNTLSTPALPSNNITCLANDAANNIWIGTYAGLVKFDGTTFTSYNTSNGLISNTVTCIETIGNQVYIGSNFGVSRFDGVTFTNYTLAGGTLPNDTIACIKAENTNLLWLGGKNRMVEFNVTGSTTTFANHPVTGAGPLNCIYIDNQNTKWIGTTNLGILRYNGLAFENIKKLYDIFGSIVPDRIVDMEEGPNNGVIFKHTVGNSFNKAYAGFTELTQNGTVHQYYHPVSNFILGDFIEKEGSAILISQGGNYVAPKMYHSFNNAGYLHPFGSINTHNIKTLDKNNVKAGIANRGDMHWDMVEGENGHKAQLYEVPKGSGKHSGFAASLWISGLDNANQLHGAAQTYRRDGFDFWPGPLDTITGSIDTATSKNYDRIWKIDADDINTFITAFNSGSVTATPDMLTWPAHGSGNKARNLAPFVDHNGDGIYDPYAGDYPKIKGDQALYFIFNDNLAAHSTSFVPMGVEVQGMAYSYGCSNVVNGRPELTYTTFYDYKIINRSVNNYHDVFISLWNDADLGGYTDDYIGCNVTDNYGYTYNGDNFDNNISTVQGYGSYIPAQGYNILKGPLADLSDGIDNNNDGTTDEVGEECRLNKFTYYFFVFDSQISEPVVSTDFRKYMTGFWSDGAPYTCGGNAYGGSIPTSFVYPSDTYTYGVCGATPWSDTGVPGDRIMVLSSGPFALNAGQVQEVEYAVVTSFDSTSTINSNLLSVAKLKTDMQKINAFYNLQNKPSCIQSISVGIDEVLKQNDVILYPNPSRSVITIQSTIEGAVKIDYDITDVLGRTVMQDQRDSNRFTVNVSDLTTGIYFIRLKINNSLVVKKFVKE